MGGRMVIDTPANESVTTSLVCLNLHLTIYGRDFGINIVFLPLSQIDVILGMNWLKFNCIYINCYKTMLLTEFVEEKDPQFMSSRQVEEFLKDESQVFAMFTSLKVERKAVLDDLPVVSEFPLVFPGDIIHLPP
ncbi:uncharacterized protein LOC127082047 [Lathyrus oleraceus]|uniref:uncharacterized protein LOC127082047 n=1 Tax=Pisum sativum TaxID=3888 RepID=UPI0021D09231|nr:uncharacterized protein LOC127082047 [Pisum sativum]